MKHLQSMVVAAISVGNDETVRLVVRNDGRLVHEIPGHFEAGMKGKVEVD